ncbi:MAG: antibiotic biosynthesis monooxygenase [Acidimicrobiia bacterium]|nr:antibiotic biosynthesis monooxygenase [Acidimicrobiia bacterium]MDH5372195.1 antibiotic biosynthesis monooxygenase [Acidimicrobiia bacterium]MDH5502492.1 antibiotic biosynthesis monooxygenase [Acidimicrobiia bacterium]
MVIRLFLSAVSAADLDKLIAMFKEDVIPAFESAPGCLGIELIRAEKAGVGGLIEGGVIIRWESAEHMESALNDPAIIQSQHRVRALLRREPLRKVYEVIS